MKKIWVKKFKSFKEAEEFDNKYYEQMSSAEKWDTMQFLRESYLNFRGHKYDGRKGLQRVLRITKQTQS